MDFFKFTARRLFVFLLVLAVLLAPLACGDDDDDDDDNNDDDDDDTADDDTADDDAADDDTGDDDTVGVVAFTELSDDRMGLSLVTEPLGAPTRLVDVVDHMAMYPAISPDGQTIAFGANLHDPNPGVNFATMLYTIPTVGGEPARLTDEDYTLVTENTPLYSPDGQTIAYVRSHLFEPPANLDRIWLMAADGTNRRALYDDAVSANDWNPSFSLDGQWLVHMSDRDDWCADVYLADLSQDPPTRTRLTESDCANVDGNYRPFFDETGEWVYFESARDESYGLYRVAATGGTPELMWDIRFCTSDEHLGAPYYYQFRPTDDRLSLIATGTVDTPMRAFTFATLEPVATPVPVTGLDVEAVDPAWWKPAQ